MSSESTHAPNYPRRPPRVVRIVRTRPRLFIAAAVSVALGSTYVGFSILHQRDNSDLAFHLVVGAGWLLIGGEKLRRALKARSNKSPVVNVEQFH